MEKLRLVDIVNADPLIEGQNADFPEAHKEIDLPEVIGILPIRNAVIFPGTVAPLAVGREKSRKLLEDCQIQDSNLLPEACCPRGNEAYIVRHEGPKSSRVLAHRAPFASRLVLASLFPTRTS